MYNNVDLVAQSLIIKVMKAMDEVVRTPEEIAETPLELLRPEAYQFIFRLATAASIAVMEEVVNGNGEMEQTKWS